MVNSFAAILAEANEMTRTHHERAAAITRAHFAKRPDLAEGIDVERRCRAGWWGREQGSAFADVPEFFEKSARHQHVGYQKASLDFIVVDMNRIPRFYATETGHRQFEQAETARNRLIKQQREANRKAKQAATA